MYMYMYIPTLSKNHILGAVKTPEREFTGCTLCGHVLRSGQGLVVRECTDEKRGKQPGICIELN